jgi:hypothetical protein
VFRSVKVYMWLFTAERFENLAFRTGCFLRLSHASGSASERLMNE